jgi:Domain of unknown function (DUF4190)/GYF domain 2
MNYKIIGNDGKTYGPIGAEQINAWIAQGRIESRTPVFVDGAADWTFVGLLPEFAQHFSQTQPAIAPPKPVAAAPLKTNGFATAGFVCGLISLMCCCGCPFNILGLVFSIIALVQIGSAIERQAGFGFALAGLICSAASLLLSFGFGVLELLSAPNGAVHFNQFQ